MTQILQRIASYLLWLCVYLVSYQTVQASHTMGADITYQCLGGNSYKITLSFYRDCIGIPAPASPFVTINSASCGQSLGVTCYPRVGTGQEVTPACSSSVTTCNGGSFTGIQEWIYDGIVTLPMACSDWVFGYALCCRNAAITTISSPGASTFYIYATLNNLITPCNSSPTFSNKPVPFLCLGQQYCFNHGAYDADGDSLVYSLITPKQTASTTVNYLAPYNASNPLNSSPATSFNQYTGDICLTPQALEVTVMAVLVSEYRNGVLIGRVERDLQLTVMNCSNNLPSLTGINGTNNFSITVCANQQTCFFINSNDPDGTQNLTVTWDYGIPGATFNATSAQHPVSTFCWTPTSADIGNSYSFTARVADDACPYIGSQVYSYTINVVGISVNAGPDQNIACSDLATITATATGGSGTYTYLWNTGSTMQAITVPDGTYWVTASDGSCTATDTVVVSMPFTPTAAFSYIPITCVNNPVPFTDQSTTPGGIITNWDWDFGDGGISTLQNPIHQFATPGTYDVTLIIENSLGCLDTIVQQITIQPPPTTDFTYANGCVNTTVSFTDLTTPAATTWQWTFGDGGISGSQNPTHIYTSPGTYTVTLISGIGSGCVDTAVHSVTIYPSPTVNAGANQTVCAGGSATLTATGGVNYVWTPGGYTDSTIVVTPGTTTNYYVTVTNGNGCVAMDTVTVIVNPVPNVNAGPDKSSCSGDPVSLTATGAVTYVWLPMGYTTPTITVDPAITSVYTVVGTDPLGCKDTDMVSVNVNPLPIANAGPDVTICGGTNATLTASGGTSFYWSPTGDTTSTINVSPGTSTQYTVVVTDVNGCSATDYVVVDVNLPPDVHLQSFFLCAGSVATLDAGVPGDVYLWSPTGETTQTISVTTAGSYSVLVTDAFGCSTTSSCTITNGTSINISLANVSFCSGGSAVLDAGYPGMNYTWAPNGETTQTITINTAGTYGVTVVDTTGCGGSITVTAIMNPIPNPNFSASSSCVGNTSVFTDASNVSVGTISNWNWNFGDTSVSMQQNPTHIYGNAGSYTVTLTTTSSGGCTNSISQVVNVNPLPVADFNYSNTCQSTTVPFTDISSVSSGNIVTYAWNFGDASTSAAKNPTHQYATPGNYTVTLTVTTAGGCTGTISHQVLVHPLPNANFSTTAVCLGAPTVFANSSTISTGSISNYFWDFNDTYTSNQTSPSHTYTNPGTYSVSLVTTSNNGCIDTITKSVTVYALPSANAGADKSMCAGSSVILTATGGSNYTWTPGGQTTSTITINPSSSGNYTVTVTDGNGCSASDVVAVQVNPLPVIIASPDNSICAGGNVSLSASGAISYLWSPGGQTNSSISVSPSTTTNYIVTGTDANGCPNSDSVRVTVNNIPIIGAGPDQSICLGSTIALVASGGTAYQWNPIGATTSTILVTPTSNSTYILIGSDAYGCINSDTVSIVVNPVPVVTLFPTFVCSGYSTTLDAGNPGSTYSWSNGDTTQTIGVSTAGNYSVIVVNSNGCSAIGNTTVTVGGSVSGTPTVTAVCLGQSALLDAGNPGSTYLWTGGSTSQTISVTSAGTYYVTVTASNGCSATLMHSVNINPLPVVGFAATSACLNSATVFTDQSTVSSGSNQVYQWDFGDSYYSASQNSSHTYALAGNYSVTLTVTTSGGCISSATQAIQVYELPVADFTPSNACVNAGATFSDLSTVNSGSITGWDWNFGDASISSSQNPTHNYATNGSFTATLIVTSSQGCRDTVSRSLTIHGLPQASFSAPNACAQSDIQFTNTSSSLYGTISSQNWDFGDSNTSTIQNPTNSYVSEGVFNAQLIVTSSLGCIDTATLAITIHPMPDADFTVGPACAGTPTSFTNISSVVTGTITNNYWSFGDNSTSGVTSPAHAYANDGSFNISLIATTNYGCRDTVIRPVQIFPVPQASFTALDVCAGTEVEFYDATTVSSGSISTWAWIFGDLSTSAIQNPAHIYATNGTFPVQLTVTSNNGCTNVYSNNINIFPNPVVAFATTNVCFGNANSFVNLSSVGGGISFTSEWDFSDGTIDPTMNPTHTFQVPGNFNVTLTTTTSNGCVGQITESMAVYQGPYTMFSTNNGCLGTSTQFNDNSTAVDGSIASWNWNFGDGTYSVETNPLHQYSNSGHYNVNLRTTTTFGCYSDHLDSLDIYARPNAGINAQSACLGVPTQFVNTSVNNGLGTINYQWDLGNGTVITDSAFTYSFTTPGDYDVTLVATTAYGCSTTDLLRLSVFPTPTAHFNGLDACLNSPTTFTNQSTISAGYIANWTWSLGDGSVSTQNTVSHIYSAPGTYSVSLTAVSDEGCTSTALSTVRVNPNPTVSFGSGATGCSPITAAFHDNSLISSGNITAWLWNFGDGAVSTDQHPSHTFTQGGNYDVMLSVVSDAGCQNSFTQNGLIRVYASPVANFNMDPMVTDILTPTVHFDNTSTGYSSYLWVFSDGYTTNNDLNPVHTFQDTGTYTALLITVNAYGCRDTIAKTIEVLPHSTLYVPNCFTPNGDGTNDVFRPYWTQMSNIQVWIFDRWGKLLTNWDSLEGYWDGYYEGRKCQSDTYVYKIRGLGLDGKYSEWVGHVSIVY